MLKPRSSRYRQADQTTTSSKSLTTSSASKKYKTQTRLKAISKSPHRTEHLYQNEKTSKTSLGKRRRCTRRQSRRQLEQTPYRRSSENHHLCTRRSTVHNLPHRADEQGLKVEITARKEPATTAAASTKQRQRENRNPNPVGEAVLGNSQGKKNQLSQRKRNRSYRAGAKSKAKEAPEKPKEGKDEPRKLQPTASRRPHAMTGVRRHQMLAAEYQPKNHRCQRSSTRLSPQRTTKNHHRPTELPG
ncbi:uncharacterized protein LOC112085468 [Eutrema salsugineum]|uniref:uncharacterized protein LOC112085468 n=1 Tax=Eutrema salsugineum TaxID=72664 RepID=UPI000CED01A1|nr:uncharacterized protein LOC112085468 [Eutrema salsugineum]